jgi:hypothetical protein
MLVQWRAMKMKQSIIKALAASAALVPSSCGTYVPNIQELSGNADDGLLLVQAIVQSIHCELRRSVNDLIDNDETLNRTRTAPWFDTWGVQIGLTLTIEESSSLSPNSLWTRPGNPGAVFEFGGGGSLSSTATRTDKLSYYYTVHQLRAMGRCSVPPPKAPQSLLVRSDLKLEEWLDAAVLGYSTHAITVPANPTTYLQQNALSHEVKFQVVSSADVNPAWELKNISYDQKSSLFSARRDRTHDLTMTFGPAARGIDGLTGAAEAAFLSSQIGLAINRPGL